jgi:hypothetical protein
VQRWKWSQETVAVVRDSPGGRLEAVLVAAAVAVAVELVPGAAAGAIAAALATDDGQTVQS